MTLRFGGGMMCGMQRFVDDDRGYLNWLAQHPDGFVINTGRTPTATYLVLHRAGCGTINGTPARETTFTGDYAKVCGARQELEMFGRELGGQAQPCGLCLALPSQRASAGGKYNPLRDHLASCQESQVQMTFAQVDELVGPLPDSAYRHRAWWGNNDVSVQAKAWLDASWQVQSVNQAAKEVVFARVGLNQTRNAPRSAAGRLTTYIDPQISVGLEARARVMGLDSGKLVRLIAELNDNYNRGNACAAHALLRAVLDHVPRCLPFPTSSPPLITIPGVERIGTTRVGFWISNSKQMMPCIGRSRNGPTAWASTTCHRKSG